MFLKKHFNFLKCSNCRQSYFIKRKGSGNEWVSRMESAVGIHFRRGKQQVSRLLSRWNLSVYSSVWTSRNPDFDLGVDFVDAFKIPWESHGIFVLSINLSLISLLPREGFKTFPSNLRFATFPFRDGKNQCKWFYEKRNEIAFWWKFWLNFKKPQSTHPEETGRRSRFCVAKILSLPICEANFLTKKACRCGQSPRFYKSQEFFG